VYSEEGRIASMSKKMLIVGSGFTRAVFGEKAPTNANLLQELRQSEPVLWQRIAERYPTNDVEVALTRLDLDINKADAGKAELIAERLRIETDLARFFRKFRFNEELVESQPWVESLVKSAFKPGDVAVCLNYDCLLEGLLDRYGLWSLNGGYGQTGPVFIMPIQCKPSPVTVLKIHGSENFHLDRVVIGSDIDKVLLFTVDESIFPISGRARHFNPPEDHSSDAIIAPSFVKIFPSPLLTLMLEALEATELPEILVIIGCALRPEDSFLHLLVLRYLQGLRKSPRRILVIDPCANSVCSRLSKTLEYDLSDVLEPIEEPLEKAQAHLTRRLPS
jgi:hypothetical protein